MSATVAFVLDCELTADNHLAGNRAAGALTTLKEYARAWVKRGYDFMDAHLDVLAGDGVEQTTLLLEDTAVLLKEILALHTVLFKRTRIQ